jgi:hypothetical protein
MKRHHLLLLVLLALALLALPARAQDEDEDEPSVAGAKGDEDASRWKARALVAEDRIAELKAEAERKERKWQEALVSWRLREREVVGRHRHRRPDADTPQTQQQKKTIERRRRARASLQSVRRQARRGRHGRQAGATRR